QFQLHYRYDDDPVRERALELRAPATVNAPAPAGAPPIAFGPKGVPGGGRFFSRRLPDPILLARAGAAHLTARESRLALAPVPARGKGAGRRPPDPASRLRVVLRDVSVRDGAPPYDVFLAARSGVGARARLGSLAQFGGAGRSAHSHGGAHAHAD